MLFDKVGSQSHFLMGCFATGISGRVALTVRYHFLYSPDILCIMVDAAQQYQASLLVKAYLTILFCVWRQKLTSESNHG